MHVFSLLTNIYDSSVTVDGWPHEEEGRDVVNVKGQVRFTWHIRHCCYCLESRWAQRITESPASHRNLQQHSSQTYATSCRWLQGIESHVIRSALPPTCLTRYHPNRENYHSPSPQFLSKALIYGSFNVTFVLFHYLKPIGCWSKTPTNLLLLR